MHLNSYRGGPYHNEERRSNPKYVYAVLEVHGARREVRLKGNTVFESRKHEVRRKHKEKRKHKGRSKHKVMGKHGSRGKRPENTEQVDEQG